MGTNMVNRYRPMRVFPTTRRMLSIRSLLLRWNVYAVAFKGGQQPESQKCRLGVIFRNFVKGWCFGCGLRFVLGGSRA